MGSDLNDEADGGDDGSTEDPTESDDDSAGDAANGDGGASAGQAAGAAGSTGTPSDTDEEPVRASTDTADGVSRRSTDVRSALGRARADPRRGVELLGLGLTAALATLLIGFVVCYWLREYPVAGPLYEQYSYAGAWMDYYLGTNVFRHPFMWQSIATGVLIGIVAPLVGTFLVHRQMALIGETLAHTAFAGVAIGFVAGGVTGWSGSPLIAALAVSVLGALGVQWLAERTDAYGDVPIAIMLTGSFAVGTILVSYGRGQTGISIEDYIFGSLSVVTPSGARLMVVLSVVVVAAIALTYKQLLFITFDEQAARVARLNVSAYNALLVVLTAVVVVGAMQVLGVILVAGMLVIPVAAASQVARGFRETLSLSVLFGQASIVGGFAISIHQGLPSGGSIIVVAIALYLATVALSARPASAVSMH